MKHNIIQAATFAAVLAALALLVMAGYLWASHDLRKVLVDGSVSVKVQSDSISKDDSEKLSEFLYNTSSCNTSNRNLVLQVEADLQTYRRSMQTKPSEVGEVQVDEILFVWKSLVLVTTWLGRCSESDAKQYE